VPEAVGRDGELQRDHRLGRVAQVVEVGQTRRAAGQEPVDYVLSHDRGEELVENDPLVVADRGQAGQGVGHALVDQPVVEEQERGVNLAEDLVLVVSVLDEDRAAVRVPG